MLDLIFGATSNATLNGTNTSVQINCPGATHVRLHAVTSSSLETTITASVDGTNFVNHPDTASWNPSTGGLLTLAVGGFKAIKVTRTSGSGGVSALPIFAGGGGTAGGAGDASASNQSTMITSLQLIDDAIYADDAAFTPATSKVAAIGAMADETSSDSVDEGDVGIPRMTLDRQLRVHPSGAAVQTGLVIDTDNDRTVLLNGAAGVAVEVTAVDTSPVITVTGILASGGTARNIECIQVTGGYGRFRRGGVNISLAAADRLYIIGDYYSVTLTYGSGTSATVTTRTMTQSAAMKIQNAPTELKPIGSTQNIVAGTFDDTGGVIPTIPTGATGYWFAASEATLGTPSVYYLESDGTDPTSTNGAALRATNLEIDTSGSDLIAAAKYLGDGACKASFRFYEHVQRMG